MGEADVSDLPHYLLYACPMIAQPAAICGDVTLENYFPALASLSWLDEVRAGDFIFSFTMSNP